MRFPSRWHISPAQDGDDLIFLPRPEISFVVQGGGRSVSLIGLVDTGSDHTILPKSVADKLGIATADSDGPPAQAFGGEAITLRYGEVVLQLVVDDETLRWPTEVCFYDFPLRKYETVVLGHAGFLDYFTASFDGKNSVLSLTPNDDLPLLPKD